MSYIQIEIGGKLRGLKFNQGALMIMNEYQPDDTVSFSSYAIIYAALRTNAYVKRLEFVDEVETDELDSKGNKKIKEVPITFEMVCDWVDDVPTEVQAQIIECLKETAAFKRNSIKTESEQEPEEDKKKLETTTEPIVTESPVDT